MFGQADDLTDDFAIQSAALTTIKNSFLSKIMVGSARKTQLGC